MRRRRDRYVFGLAEGFFLLTEDKVIWENNIFDLLRFLRVRS